MTKQETFDTVAAHLRKQGVPALDGENNCRYRTESGLQCAAGCLIPDDRYDAALEGELVINTDYQAQGMTTKATELIRDLGHDVNLVAALQRAHDGYSADEWEERFQYIAKRFGLVYSPVTGGQA